MFLEEKKDGQIMSDDDCEFGRRFQVVHIDLCLLISLIIRVGIFILLNTQEECVKINVGNLDISLFLLLYFW